MKCLSLHVFYYNRILFLVSKLLPPLFKNITSEIAVNKFFYIIYNEGGPHVRIRILCNENEYDSCLELTKKFIVAFLQSYPSDTPGEMNSGWYPNNSVHNIEYQPEFDRYGGQECIQIAETYFMFSTISVLDFIKSNYSNYINNFIFAIKLHIAFSSILFDNDEKQMKCFFEYIYQFRYGSRKHAQFFIKYDENLMSTTRKFRNKLQKFDYNDNIIAEWLRNSHSVIQELKISNVSGWQNDRVWEMMLSYFHMTNNRLGIKTYHEEYIYYYIIINLNEISARD